MSEPPNQPDISSLLERVREISRYLDQTDSWREEQIAVPQNQDGSESDLRRALVYEQQILDAGRRDLMSIVAASAYRQITTLLPSFVGDGRSDEATALHARLAAVPVPETDIQGLCDLVDMIIAADAQVEPELYQLRMSINQRDTAQSLHIADEENLRQKYLGILYELTRILYRSQQYMLRLLRYIDALIMYRSDRDQADRLKQLLAAVSTEHDDRQMIDLIITGIAHLLPVAEEHRTRLADLRKLLDVQVAMIYRTRRHAQNRDETDPQTLLDWLVEAMAQQSPSNDSLHWLASILASRQPSASTLTSADPLARIYARALRDIVAATPLASDVLVLISLVRAGSEERSLATWTYIVTDIYAECAIDDPALTPMHRAEIVISCAHTLRDEFVRLIWS